MNKAINLTLNVRVAWWFKLMLALLGVFGWLKLMSYETAVKIVGVVSDRAFEYKVGNKGKWQQLDIKLGLEERN